TAAAKPSASTAAAKTASASKAVKATKAPALQSAQKAVTATAQPTKNAFKTTNGQTYYYDANGQVVKNQFVTVNGKQYYAEATGKIAKNTSKTLNGIKVSLDNTGAVKDGLDHAQLLRDQTEFLTAVKLNKGVKYDWTESKNGYQESAVHEMAQLLAQGSVKEDSSVIASLMEKNSSMQGKVLASLKADVSKNNETAAQFVKDLVSKLGSADAAGSIVGAGYYNGTLAGLIYKVESVTQPAQASSTLAPSVTKVYGQDKVSVKDGLKDGQAFTADESKQLLANISSSLLTGPAGTEISQDVLQAIEAGIGGDDTAYVGTSNYTDAAGKTYHYAYWLEGTDSASKLANFLALNKGVKYGESIKANFTATLTEGSGNNSDAVNETPTSKKTADEITAAYQNGTETGLKYESVKVEKIPGMSDDMARGVDVSTYQAMLKAGVKYYDFSGKEADLFDVLKEAGVNWVRLRLWNNPYNADGNGYGGGNTDEEGLIKTALQAKKYGMKVLLDFHYSDFWADPAKQLLPKAWENLSKAELNESISLYTSKVLTDMAKAGVAPSMVQIGNEITKGCFGYDADQLTSGNWTTFWQSNYGTTVASYLATAAKAVRSADKDAKIAVQFETPDVDRYRMIMTVLKNNGVDYDYLGTSYYPFWGSSNNNPDNLLKVQEMAQKEFGKRLVVMETSWLNNVNDSDGTGNNIGYAPSDYAVGPQGQVDELTALYKSLVQGGGVGAFYWEPAQIAVRAGWNSWNYNKQLANVYGTGWASKYAIGYAPDNEMYYNGKETWGGSTWDNMGLFDDHGYPLQSLMVYKGMMEGYTSPENTASAVTTKISAVYGTDGVTLPAENALSAGQSVQLDDYLSQAAAVYLNGTKGTAISEGSLKALFSGLSGQSDAIKSAQFTDADGNKYHWEYWLEGDSNEDKLANFLKANSGAKYGDALTANYTATLVKDKQDSVSATSSAQPSLTQVWGLDGVTIDKPLAAGSALPEADVTTINSLLASSLTGEKGEAIPASAWDKVKSALAAGVNGNDVFTVTFDSGSKSTYRYVYYLDTTDLADLNKDAKYGDPVKLNLTASLKWIQNL
ncbi:glycosyl hydrolase 53 family protein, partial [Lactobacillus nasalidis]